MDVKVNFKDGLLATISLDNRYIVRDETKDNIVRILMLKGEKGDSGGTWGEIDGNIASQVDLQNALSAKADVASIPTKTSQLSNDSGFVVDNSYVHTDNNFTSAEKSKLASVAQGAEVNVNADWEAASGDAQILNKPSIPTKTSDLTNDSDFVDSADLAFKVSKAGDTMTGKLIGKLSGIAIGGEAPVASITEDPIQINDSGDGRFAILRATKTTANATEISLINVPNIGGTNVWHGVTLGVNADKTKYVTVSDAEAWRTGIGAVNIAGDTMTGTLNTPTTRIYDSTAPMLTFISSATDTSALAAIYSSISGRNLVLRTRGTSGYVEDYMLPNNTATGSHKSYNLINSKELIPWKTTTTWSTAVANALMDIKMVFDYTPATQTWCFVIDIPVCALSSSYKFFFYTFNEGANQYYAQVYARTASVDYVNIYKNNTAESGTKYSYYYAYR